MALFLYNVRCSVDVKTMGKPDMKDPGKQSDAEVLPAVEDIRTAYPNGHFYSPVVNTAELTDKKDRIWPDQLTEMPGIKFNDRSHKRILAKWFPRFMPDYDYPEKPSGDHDETQFHTVFHHC
jgi:hypothetical protein